MDASRYISRRDSYKFVWAGGLLYFIAACTGNPTIPHEDDRHVITVSILPQKYFVERIGRERVRVEVLVGPGESPITYEPKPSQLKGLSVSTLYFRIGVPFEEAWMRRLAPLLKDTPVIDISEGIERRSLGKEQVHVDHSHVQTLDPHTWLSPRLGKQLARAVCDALCRMDPKGTSTYQANLSEFLADIEVLDEDLSNALSGIDHRAFLVFHPSWGYFADAYGLHQVSVEVGGQEPSAAELTRCVRTARDEGIRVIFAQPEFDVRKAQIIANAIDGEVILVSPLDEDWLQNLRRLGKTLSRVLRE